MSLQTVTPVGRIVQGNLAKPNTKDINGQPLVWKSGDSAGQPRVEYFIGLAIPKNDPGITALFDTMGAAAAAGFPGGQANTAGFAWKYFDGDSLDKNGTPFSARPGMAGCYIFKLSTSYAPKAYLNQNGAWVEVGLDQIKTGDYVAADISIDANGNLQNPGVYLNLNMIQWVGVGEAIVSGPNVEERFGNAAAAVPAGATAPTIHTGGAPTPGAGPAASAPAPVAQAAPAAVGAPPGSNPAAPAPAPAGVTPAPAPAPGHAAPSQTFTQPPVA